ncbi:HNH endonuclease [Candidatus Nitrosocosmicus franklandus]|uniref:HNH endonuclease n=1 Tax=Candidatus Nitrosocosmicus franklandianus TaxID=1798806 RepID=UPI00155976A5|nr:HNH endonuclease [Candidatus Nitrosocosmicus franklandus]
MSFFGNAAGSNSRKKDKYKELTLAIKQIVLERAKHRCQICSKKLSGTNSPHFIHISGSKKDNRPENLRAICPACYEEKSPKDSGNMFSSFKKIFSKS